MKVAIVTGSDSDLSIIKETVEILEKFGIGVYISITSAHRTPEKIKKFLKEVENKECEVIIAAAGMAAHLAGVIAAHTVKPVIGVPMESKPLNGFDSLLSMVQMPSGIPVATVTIGKAGAINAGLLAIEILALKYKNLKEKLLKYRKEMARKIIEKDNILQKKGIKKYVEDTK
jgi:5-(carboxyamino)imidazole ribonucleotide mutase